VRLVVAVAVIFLASSAVAQDRDDDARMARVEAWLKAILHHQPGELDDAAQDIARWSVAELQALSVDAVALSQMMRDPRTNFFTVRRPGQRDAQRIPYTSRQLDRMRLLACAAAGIAKQRECLARKSLQLLDDELLGLNDVVAAASQQGQLDYVLRRAAMLHADVAMSSAPELFDSRPAAQVAGAVNRVTIHIEDGRNTATNFGAVHWDIGRSLLAVVRPAGDPMILLWYQATAAWMQANSYHESSDHLIEALRLFPHDPILLFLGGCEHESFARPAIQTALRSADLPPGYQLDVQSEAAEIRQAEALFRRALDRQPDHVEARLRLGRTLFMRGRAQDAAEELRRAHAAAGDDLLKYYAAMFLGRAEEALGNLEAASDLYSRASTLYPTAQSPYVAHSALARRRGDRAGALDAMEQVFELAANYPYGDDPWWTYDVAAGRDQERLLDSLKQIVAAVPQ
jgi:tetratricopeptide (TPR) repeat protein